MSLLGLFAGLFIGFGISGIGEGLIKGAQKAEKVDVYSAEIGGAIAFAIAGVFIANMIH